MIKSSIRCWFDGGQVDWMMNTSWPRMFSSIFTNVSPSGKLVTVASPRGIPMLLQMSSARALFELPEKIFNRDSLI